MNNSESNDSCEQPCANQNLHSTSTSDDTTNNPNQSTHPTESARINNQKEKTPIHNFMNRKKAKRKFVQKKRRTNHQATTLDVPQPESTQGIAADSAIADIVLPNTTKCKSRAGGNEAWMKERKIRRLSSRLEQEKMARANTRSVSEKRVKAVKKQSMSIRRRAESLAKSEKEKRIKAATATKVAEAKMIAAESKASSVTEELKELRHQHWRDQKAQRTLLLATTKAAEDKMEEAERMMKAMQQKKLDAIDVELKVKGQADEKFERSDLFCMLVT